MDWLLSLSGKVREFCPIKITMSLLERNFSLSKRNFSLKIEMLVLRRELKS